MKPTLAACLLVLLSSIAGAEGRPEVRLDPRVELSAALDVLASSHSAGGFRDDGSPYAKALLVGLRAHASHPATAAYARAARRESPGGFVFMAPLRELVLCLDDALALRSEPEECRRSGLAHAAADFARETRFLERLASAGATIKPALDAVRAARDAADLVGLFESYSGAKTSRQRVAPSPLLENGQAWNGLERTSAGSYGVVSAISPVSTSTAGPVFSWGPVTRDIWHEHAHGLMDPASDALDADVRASEGLFSSTEAAKCYDGWKQCVREHIAQGTSARMLGWARKEGKLKGAPEAVLNTHLPWENLIIVRLGEYESDRRRYATLAAFTPRLLAVFREEATRRGVKPPAAPAAVKTESDPNIQRGIDLFASGKHADAATAFEAAIKVSGPSASSYLSLSVALAAGGRATEAASSLDKAVELARADAGSPPDLLADALSSRSAQRAEKALARKDLEEALVSAPLDWRGRADAQRRLDSLR